jgi:hypothetical protein
MAETPGSSRDAYPGVTSFRRQLALNHELFGWLNGQTGKRADVETAYRAAMAIWQKLADEHPTITDFRIGLARAHDNLAVVLLRTGRRAAAECRQGLGLRGHHT